MSPALVSCGFCAREFREDRGQPACRACPLSGCCHTIRCPYCGYENPVRCPYCGYENPVPPAWLSRLSRLVTHEPG